jgi:hypothetical protein
MPVTTAPSASIASKVANTGIPRTKFRVPSIGSMMSRVALEPAVAPCSSPRRPSVGWRSRTSARAIASIA